MLDHTFISEQKIILEALQRRLKDDISQFASKSHGSYHVQFPEYGTGDEENAMEVQQHSLDVDRLAKLEKDLASVERALAKIGEGTYGMCDGGDGHAIPIERLRAIPEAVTCAQHADTLLS